MSIDWLSHIRDSIQINRIAIPGTHDAASWTHNESANFPPFTWAQRLNFLEQLNIGIRVLDMRIGWRSSWSRDLIMFHGPAPVNDQSLDDVLVDVRGWLDNNPNEFVILIFQQQGYPHIPGDCAPDVKTLIENRFGKFGSQRFFYFTRKRQTWPTVGELRGRVLVMERLASRVKGFADISGWKQAGATPGAVIKVGDHLNVYLQDKFEKISDTFISKDDDNAKKMAIVKAAAKFVPDVPSPTLLRINHTSYSNKRYQPWTSGTGVNQLLRNSRIKIQGILMIDDADQTTVTHILNSNPDFMKQ
jgi:hypothetical protein